MFMALSYFRKTECYVNNLTIIDCIVAFGLYRGHGKALKVIQKYSG